MSHHAVALLAGAVREAFQASGISDEELGELLEEAKHDMRRERRTEQRR